MSLNFKTGLQRLLTLEKWASTKGSQSRQSPETLDSGVKIFHFSRENESERSRIHLRIDPDGSGTLIVNANRVMHLNPTAALMAWMILEEKTKEESIQAVR